MTNYMNTHTKNLVAGIMDLKTAVNNKVSPKRAVTGKMSVKDSIDRVKGMTQLLQKMSIGKLMLSALFP